MSLVPSERSGEPVIQQTQFRSRGTANPPTVWRKFWDFLRTRIGMKPLDLVERYAEATVREKEIDVDVKLLKAKQEYEKGLAETARMERESKGKLAIDQANARKTKAEAKILELAAKQIEAKKLSPKAALEQLLQIKQTIEHGGHVELDVPKLPKP